jgi:apolipoprotein N-acyltransferase
LKRHIRETALALLSGVLTALAFPKPSLFFLGWISLIPLLYLLSSRKPGRGFFLGWCGGFGFYLLLLYWIQDVPAHYGGLSWGFSTLIFALFAAFLALLWGVFGMVFCRLRAVFPRGVFVLSAFLWVGLEYILTHLLTGFPWGLLGNSQYKNLAFIQISALTGVYGLSFLIVLFQSGFVRSVTSRKKAPFFVVLGIILAVHAGGWLVLQEEVPKTAETFVGAVIQGNVPPEMEFTLDNVNETFDLFQRHIDLSRRACSQGARFVVWAELSVPLCFSCNHAYYTRFSQELMGFARAQDCTMLLGTNETAFSQGGVPKYYNTAANLNPDGELSFYYKMHLVPFGEYTPYKMVFSFISTFTQAIGELTPGENYVLHDYDGVPFASPICYEIIFPGIMRNFVKKGARFLVTITNDAWYGRSWGPYQHFGIAVLRAVEARRFLLRSATTGISGVIDPYGRVLSRSRLNTEAFLTGSITPLSGTTFYVRYGDWLSLLSLTLSGVFLILALVFKRRNDKQHTQ